MGVLKLKLITVFLVFAIAHSSLFNDGTVANITSNRGKNDTTLSTTADGNSNDGSEYMPLLIASCVLALTSISFVYKFIRLKQDFNTVDDLVKEYENNLEEKEKSQSDLKEINHQISKSLEFKDRVLFSKVLKISVYNETLESLAKSISTIIENNDVITPNKLFIVEKTLRSMIEENDIWNDFNVQFEKTRPNFYKKLKERAPNLSVNDLKHCSYVVAKLKNKDVANLINVSHRSVETARYRIKKKLGLDKESCLFTFLQKF